MYTPPYATERKMELVQINGEARPTAELAQYIQHDLLLHVRRVVTFQKTEEDIDEEDPELSLQMVDEVLDKVVEYLERDLVHHLKLGDAILEKREAKIPVFPRAKQAQAQSEAAQSEAARQQGRTRKFAIHSS